jgi:hypothetical protein
VQSRKALWCWAFLLFVVSALASPAQDLRIYEPASSWEHPELVSPSRDRLFFRDPDTRHWASRSYYCTGLSRDGYVYIIQLYHWRYAWLDRWGFSVLASDLEGNCLKHSGRIRESDLTESKEPFSVRFGGNRFEDRGRTSRIVLDADGFRCDLRILGILPPWTPGDGYAMLSRGEGIYMRKAVPVPLGRASGAMSIAGRAISGEGWVYADRSLIVMPPSRAYFTGCSFRVFGQQASDEQGPWVLALLEYSSVGRHEGLRIPMLLLAHGRQWVLASKDYQVTYEDPVFDAGRSFSYPSRIHLSARSRGYSLEGDFLGDHLVDTAEVFDQLPGLLRAIASAFRKGPLVFRMVGRFEGTLARPDGSVDSLRLAGQGDYFTVR